MIQVMENKILVEKPREEELIFKIYPEEIGLMLHWYEPDFFLIREAYYDDENLKTKIKFSDYPFVKNKMPFVSSNLINLAVDQCALIHIGLMIKNEYIKVPIREENENERAMTFEDYNRIAGDEFVTGKIEGKYRKPVLPSRKIWMLSEFHGMKRLPTGRYIFFFHMEGKEFFNIKASFIYPLNLYYIRSSFDEPFAKRAP